MENATTGKVTVTAKVENIEDLYAGLRGLLPDGQVRRVEIPDALADTGASTLSLPARVIAQLGLRRLGVRRARTTAGLVDLRIYGTVRLTLQGRYCTCDALEIPDGSPALIGQVPLGLMDWVVDPSGQRLIGNPAHGGEEMLELY